MRKEDPVSLFLILCATACHLTGTASPGWWVASETFPVGTNRTSYVGIWITVVCEEDHCTETPTEMSGSKAWKIATAVIEVLAASLYASAIVINFIFMLKKKGGTLLRKTYVAFVSGAGSIIIFGILIFVKKKAGLSNLPGQEGDAGTVGWPMMLCVAAGFVGILDGIITGIAIAKRKKLEDESVLNYIMNTPRPSFSVLTPRPSLCFEEAIKEETEETADEKPKI